MTMKKATVVQVYTRGQLPPNVRQAVLVAVLDEPVEYRDERKTHHIYVSALSGPRDCEVYLFPADENGEVLDWLELPGSRRGTDNIRMTMMDAGYDVSSWPEEVV